MPYIRTHYRGVQIVPAKMSRLRFCANLTMMFGESSNLIDRYQLAKAAGFKAVECAFPYDFPKEDLLKAKNDAGVDQVLLNAFPGTSLGFAALEGKEKDFMDSLVKSVEYCKTLGCKRLGNFLTIILLQINTCVPN